MIRSFRHGGLERLFRMGSMAGIPPDHASRLRLQLARIDAARSAADLSLLGWDWHPLGGELAGHWAVKVSRNWRLTFTLQGMDAVLVDYHDHR